MLTLGIESSCDDTSIAVVENGTRVVCNIVSSQIEIHKRFGGVVPEVASRKHLETFIPLLEEAVNSSGITLKEIDQFAVTAGPGLLGPLLTGVAAAKALSWFFKKPLVPVNHLEAHLTAAFLAENQEPQWPYVGLIVSGGNSNLVISEGPRSFRCIGTTLDDAPGELFDKIARHLGLGYPGGPIIQKTAATGTPGRYKLPRPMIGKGFEFSFSGLKTASINLLKKEGQALDLPSLCMELQSAVADVYRDKVGRLLQETGAKRLVVAGGVAANAVLRDAMKDLAESSDARLFIPPIRLCTDNAAMIAAHGFFSSADWNLDETILCNASAGWQMGKPL